MQRQDKPAISHFFMYPPPHAATSQPVETIRALHSVSAHLYRSITSKNRTKHIVALTEYIQAQRALFSRLIFREFWTPFVLIAAYKDIYTDLMRHMVSYMTTLNHPYTHGLPDRDHILSEGVSVALALVQGCRYMCREITRSSQKASKKAKEIAIDVRADVEEFFDKSLFIDSGTSGTPGHPETERLLEDLFYHLDDLCEAYDPLVDYFEPHGRILAALETRIIRDFEDISTANSVECWNSCAPIYPLPEFHSPSPPVSPSPSEEFLPWVSIERENERKIKQWESCATRVGCGLINDLRAVAFMFRDRDPGNTSLRGYEYAEAFRKGFVECHERRKISTRIRNVVERMFATSKPSQH